jgi:hypothetical protein
MDGVMDALSLDLDDLDDQATGLPARPRLRVASRPPAAADGAEAVDAADARHFAALCRSVAAGDSRPPVRGRPWLHPDW